MTAPKPSEDAMTPYQRLFPKEAQKEIVVPSAIPADERERVAKRKTSGSARCVS